ncbi:MAG TPA: FkbM family methyltransferase [Baekduia sp.]|nr:FkbM family methyltransferase [Baekduia sp.]
MSDPSVRLDDETIHRMAGALAPRIAGQVGHTVVAALDEFERRIVASAAAAAAPVAAPEPEPEPDPGSWESSMARDRADNRMTQLIMQYALSVDDDCIDVGANVGRVLEDIVRMAPQGRHVAFEPIPDHAADLRRRFAQVDVHEAALAEEAGESSFVLVPEATGYSGLRQRDYPASITATREITVRLERLDDVIDADLCPRLLKVDVEGGELGVFRGGRETISRHRPIVVFEHGAHTSRDSYGTTSEEVHDVLVGDCGLRLYDLDGEGPLSRDEFVERAFAGLHWNWVAHG